MSKKITIERSTKTLAHDQANFNRYMSDVRQYDLLTTEEEVEYFKKLRAGESKYYEIIAQKNLRFVISVAKKYQEVVQNTNLSLEDLISEGNIGLCEAIHKFDPTLGFKFISYAVNVISSKILVCIKNNIRNVRIPTNRQSALSQINKLEADLQQQHQCEIDISILQDSALTSNLVADRYKSLNILELKTEYNFEHRLDSVHTEDGLSILDVYANVNSEVPDAVYYQKEILKFIQETLEQVPPKVKTYMELYYGLNNNKPLSYKEIGVQYEITGERVRQLITQYSKRLKVKNKAEYYKLVR